MLSPAIKALILGILQGLTEFLPISSSAHLVLFPRYFGWEDPGLAFDVALHLGTLAAVIMYFWSDLWRLAKSLIQVGDPSYKEDRRLVGLLGLATIPGAVAGLLLEHKIETVFRSPALIAGALITLGLFLALADRFCAGNRKVSDLSWLAALGIGFAQSLALIPGVSRAGVTITTALALGFARTEAARFSFLMSIPIIAGAGVLKIKEIWLSPDRMALGLGFAGATFAGLAAISILMRYVQRRHYTPFAIYRWALGTFVLLNLSKFQ